MKQNQVLAWSDQLATGLTDVDDQHRRLIDIINELGDLRGRPAALEELLSVCDRLRSYAAYHFQTEDDLMQAYPVNQANKESHLKAHQGFIDRINRVAAMVATNPVDVIDQLLAFLVKWLVHHITGVDARMAREILALRAGGVAESLQSEAGPLYNALIDTVSDLYDSIGARTFEMIEMNRQLQTYRALQEEENALAQDIIMRMMQRGGLSDSKLRHWIAPAVTFSGDIVAAVRSPKGSLYAILGDATGHGLAAAITVLPVLTTFYSMAQRDLSIAQMVFELNRNLLLILPVGRFVALALVCIEATGDVARIWNGGMPRLLVLNQDGKLLQAIASSQLPLGIASLELDMTAPSSIAGAKDLQFVLYSDGLIEAASSAGETFGEDRLIAALAGVPLDQRIAAVQKAWAAHLGSAPQLDDVSLLLVD